MVDLQKIDVLLMRKNCLSVTAPSTPAVPEYRDETESLQILFSRTQAGPGRTVKQEQEEISPNHVQRIYLISVDHLSNRWKVHNFMKFIGQGCVIHDDNSVGLKTL